MIAVKMGAGAASTVLAGRRIMVAEDEYMIACEIAGILSGAGAETIGPVASVGDALQLLSVEEQPDAALLDVNLRGELAWPVVNQLLERGVPVVLATGYDVGAIPQAYAHLPRYEKPVSGRDILGALGRLLAPPVPGQVQAVQPHRA